MTTTVDRPASAAPQSRGRLTIARVVVEKIASQAAAEVSAAGGRSGGVLGLGGRVDLDARPSVAVDLAGRTASVVVRVGVDYPRPLRTVAETVRRTVIDRVESLTGIDVRRVDVVIAWLVDPSNRGRREHPQ